MSRGKIYNCDNVQGVLGPIQTSLIIMYNKRMSPQTKLKMNVRDKSPETTTQMSFRPHSVVFIIRL